MTLHLRPRQTQAVDDLRQAYASGARAPILVAPTGFGKTATATSILRSAAAKHQRCWFLAHLIEILDDTESRLAEAEIPYGNICAGRSADYSRLVQIVGVKSALSRSNLPPPDLIIVDECHLAVAETY